MTEKAVQTICDGRATIGPCDWPPLTTKPGLFMASNWVGLWDGKAWVWGGPDEAYDLIEGEVVITDD